MSSEEFVESSKTKMPEGSTGLKKILFFTNSEYGQANVVLAVAYELLLRRQYDIHIMSFEPLKNRVKDLNKSTSTEDLDPATFHTVPGLSLVEAAVLKEGTGPFPPGIKGAIKTYRLTIPAIASAWADPEYMASYEACLETIHSLDPDIIVTDPFFDQGLQACRTASRSYVVLSPNTLQDVLRKQQPFFRHLCRYPALSSGFSYPVPWSLVPANIYLKISIIFSLLTSSQMRGLMKFRKSQNLPALPPVFDTWQKENHYLVPSIPETDFPCKIESNVTSCGPILLPTLSVSELDPDLDAWLERSPTVLINLGSHIRMDSAMIREFTVGLKVILDRRPSIQILWKLKTSGGTVLPETKIPQRRQRLFMAQATGDGQAGLAERGSLDGIASEIESGRVKIMEWMSVDPVAVLQTKHIVCFVHHGGSNSFHEALGVGVPQIVLPCWLDTFEFANRVEWLGIGIWASRTTAPRMDAWELSRALMRILDDGDEAVKMSRRAKDLASICSRVGGRVKACEKIIEILETS